MFSYPVLLSPGLEIGKGDRADWWDVVDPPLVVVVPDRKIVLESFNCSVDWCNYQRIWSACIVV